MLHRSDGTILYDAHLDCHMRSNVAYIVYYVGVASKLFKLRAIRFFR